MMSDLINKRVVLVTFISGDNKQEYSYFVDFDPKVGDIVVVDTQYGPKTARISKTHSITKDMRDKAGKWVICRVDMDLFAKKMEQYNLVTEIESEIEERMKSQSRIEFYLKAAQSDPTIAGLVNQLQRILAPTPVKKIEEETIPSFNPEVLGE